MLNGEVRTAIIAQKILNQFSYYLGRMFLLWRKSQSIMELYHGLERFDP